MNSLRGLCFGVAAVTALGSIFYAVQPDETLSCRWALVCGILVGIGAML